VRRGWGNSIPFQRRYFGWIGKGELFWGGNGDYPKGLFLGGMVERSLVVFQGKKVGFFLFFCFSRNSFFGDVGWVVGGRGGYYYYYFIFS